MRLDGPFEALGYTVEGGKLKVPRKKVAEFRVCELPKNRKGVETLIGKLNFFNIFSPCFGTAMAELRKEMKLQSTGKFNLSNRMKDLLNYLLSILTNSNGLHLLDEKQYAEAPFMLFCDSSKLAYGSTLTALIEDRVVPLVATSHCWKKSFQSYCINRKEFLALAFSCIDQALHIEFRHFFLVTDSSFAVHCLKKAVQDCPANIRTALLLMRERFNFRTIKCKGEDNFFADIMSRYTIPELSERELNVQHKTKILEHMKETTITQENADEIARQHDDFQNARNNSVHIEDQITRSVNSNLPRCLNLEEGEKERLLTSLINAIENDDGCTGRGECCR